MPKSAKIEGMEELKKALTNLRDVATGAVAMGIHIEKMLDQTLEAGREDVRKHLEREDLRPKFKITALPKNQHVVILNTDRYYLGPRPDFEQLDEDQPRFYWYKDVKGQEPENIPRNYSRSLFAALAAVFGDFCNVAEE